MEIRTLVATRVFHDAINLEWTTEQLSQQNGYFIEYKKNGESSWMNVDETGLFVEIDGLHPGCIYNFRVLAYSGPDNNVNGPFKSTSHSTCKFIS